MGRELVVQLAAEGCSVATCDLNEETMAETATRATAAAPPGTRISTHLCDVGDEGSVDRFRLEVTAKHGADHIDLLFNNAGIVAGNSFVAGDRASWERVFQVCWGGVYNCSRVFLPLLVASDSAWLINTSSIQGFWVDGPGSPCTAYAAAKFAVKGFSEALIEDLRLHAPHVRAAVVMPGHISTEIGANSARILGASEQEADPERVRSMLVRRGLLPEGATDDDIRQVTAAAGELAGEFLTTSSAEAARIILDGLRAGRWRILVGNDAHRLDQAVRADPDGAYDVDTKTPLSYQGWFVPMVLLQALFDPNRASGWSAGIQLRDGDERIRIKVVDGKLAIARGELESADATLDIDALRFHDLLFARVSLDDVTRRRGSRLSGERKALERLLAAVTTGGTE
jgi:NAD(P)-dependent dehydrogenase (short-subunit alcohol dehydrogenase family)